MSEDSKPLTRDQRKAIREGDLSVLAGIVSSSTVRQYGSYHVLTEALLATADALEKRALDAEAKVAAALAAPCKPSPCPQPGHDDRWCAYCEAYQDGADAVRAALATERTETT
jgi:hypothetical protein